MMINYGTNNYQAISQGLPLSGSSSSGRIRSSSRPVVLTLVTDPASAPQRSFCQFQPKLTGRDIFTNHIFSNFYFIRLFYFLSDCFCRKDKSFSLNRHHLRGKILMTDDFLTRCTPATELTSLSGRTGGARYLLHNDLLSSVDINSRSSRLLRKLYAVDSVPRSRIISIGSLNIVYFG